MNQAEARSLIVEVLAGIAPEANLASVPGKVQLRDELDLDSMDFLNFVAALHARPGRPRRMHSSTPAAAIPTGWRRGRARCSFCSASSPSPSRPVCYVIRRALAACRTPSVLPTGWRPG